MLTKDQVLESLKTVKDPEINIDVVTLNLIYNVEITQEIVTVTMTLTTPFCPYAPLIIDEIKHTITQLGAKNVTVNITFNPPWTPPDNIKQQLGI